MKDKITHKDNCIFSNAEMTHMRAAFQYPINMSGNFLCEKIARSMYFGIYEKISELIDMAQGLEDKKLVVVSQEFLDNLTNK